jgi:hypothetical protein
MLIFALNATREFGAAVAGALGSSSRPGRPLLRPVMRGGCRLAEGRGDLQAARRHAQVEIARLPGPIRAIQPAARRYPVEVSAGLRAYQLEVTREVEAAETSAP